MEKNRDKSNNKEKGMEKIFRFDENREKEKKIIIGELEKIEKELKILTEELEILEKIKDGSEEEEMNIFIKTIRLDNQKDALKNQLEGLIRRKNDSSQHKLYNFNRDELIEILDDFIQYKDYFENPPEEAYEMDDWDYCKCKEAKEIEQLLYKYEIYDTKYPEKLPIVERIYGGKSPAFFSSQELKLDEILIVLTWLHREERWCGGAFNRAIEDKTFYNLLSRLEEIREEL